MGYKQIKLFVKPSSSYPYEGINDYFINYLNKLQLDTDDFIIGDLFNARENELLAIFSDRTKSAHSLKTSAITILGGGSKPPPDEDGQTEIIDYENQLNTVLNSITRLASEKLENIYSEIYNRYKDEALQPWRIAIIYADVMKDIKAELNEREIYQNAIKQSCFDCIKQLVINIDFWRDIFPNDYFLTNSVTT